MKQKNSSFVWAIVALLLLCFGFGMLVLMWRGFVSRSQLKSRCSYKTTAVVEDHVSMKKGYYEARLGYEYNGTYYRILSEPHQNKIFYPLGEKVKIYVDPDSPDVIYCPRENFSVAFVSLILSPFILVPLGFAFVIIKIIFLNKEENMNTEE